MLQQSRIRLIMFVVNRNSNEILPWLQHLNLLSSYHSISTADQVQYNL